MKCFDDHVLDAQFQDEFSISNKAFLKYLFDRPLEPIIFGRGNKRNIVFRVPNEYLAKRYQPLAGELINRFGPHGDKNNVTEITVPRVSVPDIGISMELGRHEHFSNFLPYHRRMAGHLIDVFMRMPSYEEFISASVFCRPRINPFLYAYAMSVAILHRPDTRGINLPMYPGLFPEKYFDGAIFSRLREEVNVLPPANRTPLIIPRDFTASDLEIEHRVAYFREDIGVNLHHWQWHLLYPFEGSPAIVRKDRRGELLYYFHSQIIARYNFERISNKLGRVKRLTDWHEAIEEGYFPKLDSLIASRVWPPRQAFSKLKDINREDQQITFDIQDLERWRDRIFEAIHTGRVINEQGQYVNLTEREGIDILGNIMESTTLSINRNFYGDLHNLGHVAIAYIHDPDNRHLEQFGVMGDSTTAMRDPVFYRWHAFVDDTFQEHKNTLPRYAMQELDFRGIQVTNVEIRTPGANRNEFSTFWQQSDIDLSRGLDFAPRGPVLVRVTHLQHTPFTYNIGIQNFGEFRAGTVRIFLAPKFDERGIPFKFREQKNLFIELDKFQISIPKGQSVIERRSSDSSVTIPYSHTFRSLDDSNPTTGGQQQQNNYCVCGWPQHMLIPKGSPEGLPAELFVMISNFAGDRVQQQPQEPNICTRGHSYCGIRGQLYPDRRSMGYPFDRLPRNNIQTLQQFLTPNMALADVKIRFTDKVVLNKNNPPQKSISGEVAYSVAGANVFNKMDLLIDNHSNGSPISCDM